ncbi:MAG: ABC transporter substrate-binding protein [Candidatus Limnocylindria bacterium]
MRSIRTSHRHAWRLGAALVATALILAACGDGTGDDGQTDGDGQALTAEQQAWLEEAQVGPEAPDEQDWEAIEAAAREEGRVVIYSVSSRIFDIAEEFESRYGVEIEAYDLGSDVQLERLRREQDAGQFVPDVLFNNHTPLLSREFLPDSRVWNFVPEPLTDQLRDEEQEPMLIQRWGSRVFIYNSAAHPDGAPFENIWDLTEPEWTGNVQMVAPLGDSESAATLQTILQHPDEMAAAYEARFGEPLTEYSEGVVEFMEEDIGTLFGEANASMEWLYRMLHNEPVFVSSTDEVAENVGAVGQDDPPVGIMTFSDIRDVEEGVMEWEPAYDVEPFFGVSYPTVLLIPDRAPNPNAAKLLIRFMLEDGYEPWNVPGDYAARDDIVAEQVAEFGIPPFDELNLRPIDPDYVYDTQASFLNLYLTFAE